MDWGLREGPLRGWPVREGPVILPELKEGLPRLGPVI
jgi:hypothetical protein